VAAIHRFLSPEGPSILRRTPDSALLPIYPQMGHCASTSIAGIPRWCCRLILTPARTPSPSIYSYIRKPRTGRADKLFSISADPHSRHRPRPAQRFRSLRHDTFSPRRSCMTVCPLSCVPGPPLCRLVVKDRPPFGRPCLADKLTSMSRPVASLFLK